MKSITISRKELYEKVWSIPVVQLAKEYNLSDNGLRKICKNFDIPLPPVGYWQKKLFDKKVKKTPLPKKNEDQEINIRVDESKQFVPQVNTIKNVVTEKIRSNKKLLLKVSDRLSSPDEVTVKTKLDIEKKKVGDFYEQVKGTVRTSSGLPSIVVTPKNIPRSLRILDNLIKNFKIMGYEIILSNQGLKIEAYEDSTSIYIREKSTAKFTPNKDGWNDRELIPNGKLALKIGRYGNFEFTDTESRLIEDQIEKILIKVEVGFQETVERRRKRKIEEEKQEELRKIEEAKQKLKDDELQNSLNFTMMHSDGKNL